MKNAPMKHIADQLATHGRYGDTMLVHMNPHEVAGIASLAPGGKLTINPVTGQPEAFLPFLAPLLGGWLGSAAAGAGLLGGLGTVAGSAIGSGLATTLATGDLEQGLISGLTGFGLGSALSGLGSAAGTAGTAGTAVPTTVAPAVPSAVAPAVPSAVAPEALVAGSEAVKQQMANAVAPGTPTYQFNPNTATDTLASTGVSNTFTPNITQPQGILSLNPPKPTFAEALKAPFSDSGALLKSLSKPENILPMYIGEGTNAGIRAQKMNEEAMSRYKREQEEEGSMARQGILRALQQVRTDYGMFGGGSVGALKAPIDAIKKMQKNPEFAAQRKDFSQYLKDNASQYGGGKGGLLKMAKDPRTADELNKLKSMYKKGNGMYGGGQVDYAGGGQVGNSEMNYAQGMKGGGSLSDKDKARIKELQASGNDELVFAAAMLRNVGAPSDNPFFKKLGLFGEDSSTAIDDLYGKYGNAAGLQSSLRGSQLNTPPAFDYSALFSGGSGYAPGIAPEFMFFGTPTPGGGTGGGDTGGGGTGGGGTGGGFDGGSFDGGFRDDIVNRRVYNYLSGGYDSLSGGVNPDYYLGRNRIQLFAEGGPVEPTMAGLDMVEGADPIAPASPIRAEYDNLVKMTIAAIKGQVEDPEAVIQQFVDEYGNEAFMQLRESVLQTIQPGAQTQGLIDGEGGGMDDLVQGSIADGRPVAVSPGEYIIPADVVSAVGDGHTNSGAKYFDDLIESIRVKKNGNPEQPKSMKEIVARDIMG